MTPSLGASRRADFVDPAGRATIVLSRITAGGQFDLARLGAEIQRDDNVLRGRIAMEHQTIFGRAIERAIAALDNRRR